MRIFRANEFEGTVRMKKTARFWNTTIYYQIAFDKNVEIGDTKYFGLLEFVIE